MQPSAMGFISSTEGTIDQLLSPLRPSGREGSDFFHMFRELTNPGQRGPFERSSGGSGLQTLKTERYPYYLESLRTRLLAKGKALNELSIKEEDLPLLQQFLQKCGLSKQDAERILGGLKRNDHNGEINLGEFFLVIDEYSLQKQEASGALIIEPSAVPRIESLLRDFGLAPGEISRVFESSQMESGLDLNKLLQRLKAIGREGDSLKNQLKLDHFVRTLEDIAGLSTRLRPATKADVEPVTEKNNASAGQQHPDSVNRVSLKDLMTAFSGAAGTPENGGHSSGDLASAIDRILERVVVPGKGKAPSTERQNIVASLRHKAGRNAPRGQQDILSPDASGKSGMPRDGKTSDELNRGARTSTNEHPGAFKVSADGHLNQERHHRVNESNNTDRSETGAVHMSRDLSAQKRKGTVQEHQRPVKDPLPSHVVDQVGKQLTRAVQRGQSAISLQVKPPRLGSLRVEIDIKDNHLKLGMTAENSTVKDILLSHVQELKDALSEQGVKLDKIDVDVNNNFGQSLANLKDGSKEGPQGGQRRMQDFNEESVFKDDGAGDDPGSGDRGGTGGRSLLDLMA